MTKISKSTYEDIKRNISNPLSVMSKTYATQDNEPIYEVFERNKDILGNLEKMTYKGYDKYVPVKKKLEEMENALKMLNKKITNKKNFKNENR